MPRMSNPGTKSRDDWETPDRPMDEGLSGEKVP
jgi:hypothetical protein